MKILIVDDDDVIIEVIKDSVHWDTLGIHEVYTACDSKTAKEIISREKTDIVISDIEMPKESGLELLEWFRLQKYTGRFLLLTCHEKFSYAARAVELGVADYLLKPFSVEAMEFVLQKNIGILKKESQLEKNAAFGQWMMSNLSEMRLTFFESLINGKILGNRETVAENIQIRNLGLDMSVKYRLVVSKVTNLETDYEQYGIGTIWFMLKNIHSELLCQMKKNERVSCMERENCCIIIAVCDALEDEEILERCSLLVKKCGELLEATVTSCIGGLCAMEDFQEESRRLQKVLNENVVYYGQPFFDDVMDLNADSETGILDMEQMRRLLEEKELKKIMDYLKKQMDSMIHLKAMNGTTLKIISLEFQQAVYGYLMRHGIMVSKLISDRDTLAVSQKAEQSVLDLLRWANYLLNQAFQMEDEVQQSKSLVSQIKEYIRLHYPENIGRNEIGEYFHMVPEYLAKVYKKKTGQTLKDSINEYRIEQAKIKLKNTDERIIDIAMECGFDNVSYFSTLFKKITGSSPNDYRKS